MIKTKRSPGETLDEWARRYGVWEQQANRGGVGYCSGCGEPERVVYSNRLQWCKDCWVSFAPPIVDTQPTEWNLRRLGQERDYEWKPRGDG